MKKVVIFCIVILFLSSFVYAISSLGPIEEGNKTEFDFSESTGSVTGIHPSTFKYENTMAMLILALMGLALFSVLTYCKRNI